MTDERLLGNVGPRLRQLRLERDATLTDLAEETGISVSTLSRLEAGQRKPTLELLLPLARAHRVALDELVDAPETGDPRVRAKPTGATVVTYVPLTRPPGGLQAFKLVLPPRPGRRAASSRPTKATSGSTYFPVGSTSYWPPATSSSSQAKSSSSTPIPHTHRTPNGTHRNTGPVRAPG